MKLYMYCFTTPTCLLSAWCGSAASLMLEVVDFAGSAAGFGASSEVGEGEGLVLSQRGEAEVLGAEEEQRVEQHHGGVGAQLLTLPQVGLLNTGGNNTTWGREEDAGKEPSEFETLGLCSDCRQIRFVSQIRSPRQPALMLFASDQIRLGRPDKHICMGCCDLLT